MTQDQHQRMQQPAQVEKLESIAQEADHSTRTWKKIARKGTIYTANNIAMTKLADHIANYQLGIDIDKKKVLAASVICSALAIRGSDSVMRATEHLRNGNYRKALQEPSALVALGAIGGAGAGYLMYKAFNGRITAYFTPTNDKSVISLPIEQQRPDWWEYTKASGAGVELSASIWKGGETPQELMENRFSIGGSAVGALAAILHEKYGKEIETQHPGLWQSMAIGAGVGGGASYLFRKQLARAIENVGKEQTQYEKHDIKKQ